MSPVVRVSRGRQARSRATSQRILDAATRLFVRDGYLTTTMADIAAEAGVAVQSLYLRFGSKLAILAAAFDVAVVGDLEPIPLLERAWLQQLAETTDGPAAVRLFVEQVGQLMTRTYPLFAVIQRAAASETGELLAENKRQRFEGHHVVAGLLSTKPGFTSDLTAEQAADLMYAQVSEDLYGLLVVERGWPLDAWQDSCAGVLSSALFPGLACALSGSLA